MRVLCEPGSDRLTAMTALQFGLEWFPDGIGGGSSRYFCALSSHLEAQGLNVHSIVTGRSLDGKADAGLHKVSLFNAPLKERLRAARSTVAAILAGQNVDVVSSHFPLYTFACLDLIRRIPIVLHFHGPWAAECKFEGGSPLVTSGQFIVEKVLYARASRAIVLTNAFGRILKEHYNFPPDKIRVIPGGVDVDRFTTSPSREAARMRLGLPVDRDIIVVVRRLARRMGLENLISGFDDLRRAHRGALLVVVGGGQLGDALRQRVRERGLGETVVFAGRVPDEQLPLYYRAADISIVPSIALEGFGMTVVESLACGTPALVTPVGGLPEVVSGLSHELILEGSSPAAISQGLHAALEGDLALPSPETCAAYARAIFSWPAIAQRVREVYDEVL